MFLSQIRYRQFVVTNSWLQTLLQSGSLFHQVPGSFGRLELSCFVFQKFHSILEPEITWLMLLISEFWKHLISHYIWKFRKFRSLKSFHPKPQGVAVQRLLGWPGSCKNSVSHESLSFLISILTKKQQKSKLQLDLPNEPVNDIWKHTGIAMPCWFNVS